MPEPVTIDEMLAWFDKWVPSPQGEAHQAIRAILERYKDGYYERKAIRAFVDRVEGRIESAHGLNRGVYTAREALREELAALEKESNAGTNDQ